MKRFVILLSALLIVTSVCFAQENIGARPIALGGAFAGLADDANAIFLNPAGIGYVRGEVASFSSKLSNDNEYTILGGVQQTAYGSFGVGYISSSSQITDLTDSAALADEGDVAVRSLSQTLVLSFARELNDFMVVPESMGRMSVGTNVKFASSRVANAKGLTSDQNSGLTIDLAAVLKPGDKFAFGFGMRNLMAGDTASEGSGFGLFAGVSSKLLNDAVVISLENGGAGCELWLIPELALRVGRDGEYNTAGIGINLQGFGIDYGY
ncbi:MAG: hypothetical protein ABID35_02390, partial [Candidatus Margulisiibacteriota bacterium]